MIPSVAEKANAFLAGNNRYEGLYEYENNLKEEENLGTLD